MSMGKFVIITEKPSVAKQFRKALGLKNWKKENNVIVYFGKYKNHDIVIVPLAGHVLELYFGDSKFSEIPLIPPKKIKFTPIKGKGNILKTLKKYLKSYTPVIATDYDSEGELIGYEILEYFKIPKNGHFRMRFSTLREDEIRQSFERAITKKERLDYNLAYAGLLRAYSDKLFGFNYTRFMTLLLRGKHDKVFSIGRVQTPTLRIIVEREKDISAHVQTPLIKLIVIGTPNKKDKIEFVSPSVAVPCKKLKKFNPERYKKATENFKKLLDTLQMLGYEMIVDKKKVTKTNYLSILENIDTIEKAKKQIKIKKVKSNVIIGVTVSDKTIHEKPPKLFSTTVALSELSKELKMKPDQVMKILQKMYESAEISYIRTDSEVFDPKKYPPSYHKKILNELSKNTKYKRIISKIKDLKPRNRGSKIDDAHPPIHPVKSYTEINEKIFDLITKRYLSAFYPDLVKTIVTYKLKTPLELVAVEDFIIQCGWMEVYDPNCKPKKVNIKNIKKVLILDAKISFSTTSPPPRYTVSTIIKQMENLKIGTKSTRQEILKKLIDREYIIVDSKNTIYATNKGIGLIDLIDKLDDEHIQKISKVEFTRDLEEKMEAVQKGKENYKKIIDDSISIIENINYERLNKLRNKISDWKIDFNSETPGKHQKTKPQKKRSSRKKKTNKKKNYTKNKQSSGKPTYRKKKYKKNYNKKRY